MKNRHCVSFPLGSMDKTSVYFFLELTAYNAMIGIPLRKKIIIVEVATI